MVLSQYEKKIITMERELSGVKKYLESKFYNGKKGNI